NRPNRPAGLLELGHGAGDRAEEGRRPATRGQAELDRAHGGDSSVRPGGCRALRWIVAVDGARSDRRWTPGPGDVRWTARGSIDVARRARFGRPAGIDRDGRSRTEAPAGSTASWSR